MQAADSTVKKAHLGDPDWRAVALGLEQENQALKQRLAWFERQLFGRKSEKRLIESPGQLDMSALLGDGKVQAAPEPTEEIHYTRRKAKVRDGDCVSEAGLRFDERVPVEVIELSAPALLGPDADQYEIIDYKITRRLAQRPGSYVGKKGSEPFLC